MIVRRAAALAILAAITTLTLTTAAVARPPSTPSVPDPTGFRPVVLPGVPASPVPETPGDARSVPAPPAPIGDFHDEGPSFGGPSVEGRPDTEQPVRPESLLKATPPPKPTHAVRGTASWYCKAGVSACHASYPGGMYAAAGPALRVGNWRGRSVTVCGPSRCVNVKLVDWCACGSGRIIDLYSDAFSRLAPLSQGTMSVRVTW